MRSRQFTEARLLAACNLFCFGMADIPLRYRHWTYVWIPLATATMWYFMLWAMLIVWLASGRPRYKSDEHIAYISDIGADVLKPLFITGCAITGVGFFLCLVVERILRNSGRCATFFIFTPGTY